jgi:phosphoglucosamine mutase
MFGTSGVRGPIGETITADLAMDIGRAVGSRGEIHRAVVGRDARESGVFLRDAVAAGLQECGVDVIDLGMVATPTLARGVSWYDADAGVMITASHNPPEDNGIKLWTPSGQAFDASKREAVERRVREEDFEFAGWDSVGTTTESGDASERHREALVSAGETEGDVLPLNGRRVAVDVGSGVGQVTATALVDLGATVETLNAQPDGRFPARPSEPTASNCASLCAHVEATGADLGVAHDGDADRLMAVDETGTFLAGDTLLALFGRLSASDGDTVVAPLNTSLAVEDTLETVGATLERTPVGDVYVAERAVKTDAVFGGEPSGAWIWPEETLCPDGPLAAVRLARLVEDGGPLSEQVASLPSYPLRRDAVETDEKERVMEAVRETVRAEYDDVSTMDGVRVDVGDGWFLVRPSGTQPLVRVTAEARDEERLGELFGDAWGLVERTI